MEASPPSGEGAKSVWDMPSARDSEGRMEDVNKASFGGLT